MHLKICPVCGNSLEGKEGYSRISPHHLGYGNLCGDCVLKQIDGLPALIKLSVPRCRSCGSIRWKGQWMPYPNSPEWEDIIASAIYPYLKDSEGYAVSIRSSAEHGNSTSISFAVVLDVGFGLKKNIEGQVEINYERSVCPSCAMASEKNYPYLIQIRGEARKLESEEVERLEHMVKTMASKHVSSPLKLDEKEGGLDVQVYSPAFSLMLRHELEKKFMAQISYSQKLLKKEKDGRLVYQKISLVRLFKLRLGSSVVFEGAVASVEGADGYDLIMRKKDGDEYKMKLEEAFTYYKSKQLDIIKY